jgi:endoglucanase
MSLLAETGAALTLQGTSVYLDAGQPGWITDTSALASALKDAGVARLAGFSLNVSNFYSTDAVKAYGHEVSRRLGGAHFVIDTSRNGNGPPPSAGASAEGGPAWCNPPGRALGLAPTSETGDAVLDGLLWIKNPGASDGDCRPGAPVVGQWWPEYALGLAQRSVSRACRRAGRGHRDPVWASAGARSARPRGLRRGDAPSTSDSAGPVWVSASPTGDGMTTLRGCVL